jgi:hypothetical protein
LSQQADAELFLNGRLTALRNRFRVRNSGSSQGASLGAGSAALDGDQLQGELSAVGTAYGIVFFFALGVGLLERRQLRFSESGFEGRDALDASAIGEVAVVADAHEARWQDS